MKFFVVKTFRRRCQRSGFKKNILSFKRNITFAKTIYLQPKKCIIAMLCSALMICMAIISKLPAPEPEVIKTFGNSDAGNIVKEVLPSENEPRLLSKIKDYAASLKSNQPEQILQRLNGIFTEPVKIQSTPAPTPAVPAETAELIQKPIEEKTSTSKSIFKNDTKYEVSSEAFNNKPLQFIKNAEVLIIHTHTTESYTPEVPTGFPDNSRNTNETKNMIAIGNIIKQELEKGGIKVVHDKTVHDYPSYQGAYGRSLTTAKKHLEQNSNIQVILDIHRDAITAKDGTRIKLTAKINETPHSQLMIVCGTDGGGLSHPQWRNNLNFAIKIQQQINRKYPNLMRPINLREERFNQHLTPGSLIIEVGTHGNTLTESKNSAQILGAELAELLKNSTQ